METSTGAGQLSLTATDSLRVRTRPPARGQPDDPGAPYWSESPIYAELVRQWQQHGRQTPRPATATPLPPEPGGALTSGL